MSGGIYTVMTKNHFLNDFDYKSDYKGDQFIDPLTWEPPQGTVKEPIKKISGM